MSNIMRPVTKSANQGPSWAPREGERFQNLLSRLDEGRAEKSRDEAIKVLRKCINPNVATSQQTSQLVLGQVQSGKTSNMAHVIGLAADNGIPLVIVLTGTKRILDSQTVRDLKRNVSDPTDPGNPWFNFREVGPRHDEFKSAQNATPVLDMAFDWFGSSAHATIGGNDGYPLCVFLLKNTQNMGTFIETMKSVEPRLRSMPTLIIDDEADQAGPDAGKVDAPSKTNVRIKELREIFEKHSYLLYTATPQAPLLSQLGNALSPESVTNLKPGLDYVGISDLFPQKPSAELQASFRKLIQSGDVAMFKDASVDEVPESLHQALAYFFVYGAVARTAPYSLPFVTMMIHTSANNKPMQDTEKWVNGILHQWRLLFENVADPDFGNEWNKLFQPALDELAVDVKRAKRRNVVLDKPEIVAGIKKLLKRNNVKVLNQTTENLLDDHWTGTFAWILIGGEKLSRGFRVENLLVTYMPRDKSLSDSALDTVQQRGRFFGYRKSYVELLKGWLPDGIDDAFRTYRDHDIHLRNVLVELEEKNLPLKSWRRVLLTNSGFVPTRRNVIKLENARLKLSPGEIAFTQSHLYVPGVAAKTFELYKQLLAACMKSGLQKGEKFGDGAQLQRSFISKIAYAQFLDFLLGYYEALSGPDSYVLSHLLDVIGQFDDAQLSNRGCLVVFHESRELDGDKFLGTPDKRGPAGGTRAGFIPEDVNESSPISGLSRSNAAGQIAKIKSEILLQDFVLHIYLFDVYRAAISDNLDPKMLFAKNSPAIQFRVPKLPLMSAVKQIK